MESEKIGWYGPGISGRGPGLIPYFEPLLAGEKQYQYPGKERNHQVGMVGSMVDGHHIIQLTVVIYLQRGAGF